MGRAMGEVGEEEDDEAPRPFPQQLLSSTLVLPKLKERHGYLRKVTRETSYVHGKRASSLAYDH